MTYKERVEGVLDGYKNYVVESMTLQATDVSNKKINKHQATQQIINLKESVVDDMEYQETEDMSLKSWTPEDYKAFGRNELRADIKSKLIGEG